MQLVQPKVTAKYLALTFRGSKSGTLLKKGFQNVNEYGKGKEKFTEKHLQQLHSGNDKCTTPSLCVGPIAVKLKNNEACFIHYK